MHTWPLKSGLALYLILMSSLSASEPLVIGGYHYPPFMEAQSSQGIYVALSKAISKESQLTFDWKFYPYARVDNLFTSGKIHIELGSSPVWSTNKPLPGLFSETFYQLEDVAVYNKSLPRRARNTQDISGLRIGMVRGYSFPQFAEVFEQKLAQRIDANNEVQLLKLLIRNRVDQVFMSKLVFLYLQKQHAEFSDMTYKDVVGSYPLAIRVHPEKAHIMPKLNKAISVLKSKNQIQKIFNQHP